MKLIAFRMKRLLLIAVAAVLISLIGVGTASAIPLRQYTGDLCEGMTVTASIEWSTGTAPATEAFDNDLSSSSFWANSANIHHLPDWIQCDFGAGGQVVAAYRIYYDDSDPSFAGYQYSPDDWEFQASHDGTNWDVLDAQSDQMWSADGWKDYAISNTAAYQYYRLYVIDTNASNTWLAVHEIEMLGALEPTPTPVVVDIHVYVDYPTPVPQYFDPTANDGDGPEPWLLRFYVGVFVVFAFTYVVFRFVDTHQFYLLFMALCMAAAWVTKSVNGAAYVYLFMLIMILVLKLWGGLQRLVGFGK